MGKGMLRAMNNGLLWTLLISERGGRGGDTTIYVGGRIIRNWKRLYERKNKLLEGTLTENGRR